MNTTQAKQPTTGGSPVDVAILAVLTILVGGFAFFAEITIDFIMMGGDLTLVGTFQLGAIIIGLLTAIAGTGLLKLKSWAWWLTALTIFFGLIINLSIVLLDFNEIRIYFLSMLIRAMILVYLMHAPIRLRFHVVR